MKHLYGFPAEEKRKVSQNYRTSYLDLILFYFNYQNVSTLISA
ncbi:hypothetical protein D2M30_1848 [Bacillus amyloliquefaciens]|nr:hypothetical protein D2M30_1848 [Bacillus amyloliquefaciens]